MKVFCRHSDRDFRAEAHDGRAGDLPVLIPGEQGGSRTRKTGEMMVTIGGDAAPVTTLTGNVDQVALQSLLQRLYSLGLPLISVVCVDSGMEDALEGWGHPANHAWQYLGFLCASPGMGIVPAAMHL